MSTLTTDAELVQREPMDALERATSCWYRDIIASEIRSAQQEVWREAARLVLVPGDPADIARKMHERAERLINLE